LGAPGLALPPPTYDPHLVGKAILFAAETPKRTLVVGFGGYMISLMGTHFPRLTDYAMEMTGYSSQVRDQPSPRERQRRDNLYRPREGAEYSSLPETSPRRTSLFLEAQLHPMATVALLAGVGLALGYAFSGGGHRKEARGRAASERRSGEREDLARVAMASYPTRNHDARRASALARH
jgi:hypothetical protein